MTCPYHFSLHLFIFSLKSGGLHTARWRFQFWLKLPEYRLTGRKTPSANCRMWKWTSQSLGFSRTLLGKLGVWVCIVLCLHLFCCCVYAANFSLICLYREADVPGLTRKSERCATCRCTVTPPSGIVCVTFPTLLVLPPASTSRHLPPTVSWPCQASRLRSAPWSLWAQHMLKSVMTCCPFSDLPAILLWG